MTTTAPADGEEVIPALDLFCANESFLHLEEDWRRGLGWWLIDADGPKHISIKDAMHLAPQGVAHEVILEAESLLWRLESEDIDRQVGPLRRNAIARFRREVALAAESPTSPMRAMLEALSLSPGRTAGNTSKE
jgi:hypothetical protein